MQEFTLTNDNCRLSLGQRIFYEKNGYLVVPKLVPLEILQECTERFNDYTTGKVPKGMTVIMKDIVDRSSVNKIQDILHDEIFLKYFKYKNLLDIVQSFTGPNIMAIHSMIINKPPDKGQGTSRHPPHQDLYYFPIRPADKIVAAWTAMEKCDPENGCLFVLPNSHRTYELMPHIYPPDTVNKMYHGIQDLPNTLKWVNVVMEPGDTVFFHPLLIHGSYKNVSNRTRKAISCHYAASECNYIDVDGTVSEPIKNEVVEIASRRFGQTFSYSDIWKFRSLLVRGIQSSM